MEEKSIKIIEDFCEIFRNTQKSIDKLECNDYGAIIGEEEIQAIENLIARYKELEKRIENINALIGKPATNYITYTSTKYIKENDFIPKSKIKEILEKLSNHNYKCNFDDVNFLQNIIIEIQELLED